MKGQFTVNQLIKPHGIARYRVDGRVNGKRVRFFCRTKDQADEIAYQKNAELQNHGHRHSNIADSVRVDAIRAAEILAPLGISLVTAAEDYLKRHDIRAKSMPVTEACNRFVLDSERRLGNDEIGKRHHDHLVKSLRKFKAEFGPQHICDLTSQQIEGWLNRLPLALESKSSHRRSIVRLFRQAKKWQWVNVNPMEDVDILRDRKVKTKLPGILALEQVGILLESASDEQYKRSFPDVLPVIAIGLFAGLRPSEINRLKWENIDWDKRLIDCSAKITKTASVRWVKMSDNLLEWLAPYRNARGPIFAGSEARQIRSVTSCARDCGITKWPQDGLRHSFGSYHLAMHEDAAKTALQMGHMSTKMVFAHYNNRRTHEEGAAYWNIRPLVSDKILAVA